MRIILQKDVDELGLEGSIVEVKPGFARNYLIPGGLALEATPQNVKVFEQRKKKIAVRQLKAREEAERARESLSKVILSVRQKAGEEGKLYGSVTSMDIASELEKQGITVDRRKIILESPIKTLGEYNVGIKLYPGVVARIAVSVKEQES
ncbi:MAG: 50S ribosomal protein L9 [Desulfobacteraceae bacterium]|jgi:large subunit ribosomal protein L9|nr:MAG: 50S ribosomal protein L9 [Desulfobacteraceae bacterium]